MLILKQIRIEKGISASQLSRDSGISLRTIQDLEKRGDCMISNAAKLASAIGCSLDALWQEEEDI